MSVVIQIIWRIIEVAEDKEGEYAYGRWQWHYGTSYLKGILSLVFSLPACTLSLLPPSTLFPFPTQWVRGRTGSVVIQT